MRILINSIDPKRRLFFAVIGNKKFTFYLTNRQSKIFMPYLGKNVLVDFKVGKRQIKRFYNKSMYVYQIEHFNQIIKLKPKKVLYDINVLRNDMKEVINKYSQLLFIDFEMTMPGYRGKHFKPEIIQVGYYLTNKNYETIKKGSYYLLPNNLKSINRRTKSFLKLDEYKYYGSAKDYYYFYKDLKEILHEYNPQIVVWGKNDIDVLTESYHLHNQKPLTNNSMFIDLLKIHKDYYNLINDIGLFDIYQRYYEKENLNQAHDAKTDAYITKLVFKAFKTIINQE